MMWRFDRFGDAVALLDEHGQSLTYAQLARELGVSPATLALG